MGDNGHEPTEEAKISIVSVEFAEPGNAGVKMTRIENISLAQLDHVIGILQRASIELQRQIAAQQMATKPRVAIPQLFGRNGKPKPYGGN